MVRLAFQCHRDVKYNTQVERPGICPRSCTAVLIPSMLIGEVAQFNRDDGDLASASIPAPPENAPDDSQISSELPNLYGPPSQPRSWMFLGLGYGYGIGCGVGPVFGIGVGASPWGIVFGGGACPVGLFCGVGFAGGAIAGQGNAYVPYGFTSSFFLTPRFVMFEQMADLYRERLRRRRLSMLSQPPTAEPDEGGKTFAPGGVRKQSADNILPPIFKRWWSSVTNKFMHDRRLVPAS